LNPKDSRSRISSTVNTFIIVLILINVLAASLETVEALHAGYAKYFYWLEIFSVVIFTIEFALRLWSAPAAEQYTSRVRFLFSFDAIIDLLAIVPFYLSFLFGIDLRALIALRLLRLLKLVRYFEPLSILGAVMKAEFRAFTAAMFVLMILVFIASTGIHVVGNRNLDYARLRRCGTCHCGREDFRGLDYDSLHWHCRIASRHAGLSLLGGTQKAKKRFGDADIYSYGGWGNVIR
jgi:voltage-gated potassium channel